MTAVTPTTPTDREIHAERIFDAPRDRVWAAFTDSAMIPQWWGPTTVVEQMDVRPGGSWRFTFKNPGGGEGAFYGTYQEVTPPERLVQTFQSGWAPGRIHIETHTFEELTGGQTKYTNTLRFDTTEERDNLLNYGGEAGMNESYARLDALLARPAAD